MKFKAVTNKQLNVIHVPKRFTFNEHRDFRSLMDTLDASLPVNMDFRNTDYLDSSALGMLLLVRDKGFKITFINCGTNVKSILEIANFKKLFQIQ